MKPFLKIKEPEGRGLVKRRSFLAWLRNLAALSSVSIGPAKAGHQMPDGLFFDLQSGQADTPFRVTLEGGKVNVAPGAVCPAGTQQTYILELTGGTPPAFPTFIGVSMVMEYVIGGTNPANAQREWWMGWTWITTAPTLAYRATPIPVKVAAVNLATASCPPVELFIPLAHLSSAGVRQMISHTISIAPELGSSELPGRYFIPHLL
jgi:hypothetical protein